MTVNQILQVICWTLTILILSWGIFFWCWWKISFILLYSFLSWKWWETLFGRFD